jgi:poly(hydroxyalkanoate) depolymerase family esterase
MKHDFAAAMRQSLEQTRAGNPLEATRTIQAALARNAGASVQHSPGPKPSLTQARRTSPRKPLSQVIAELSRRSPGPDARPGRKATAPVVPEGAVFDRGHHAGPHGARDYLLYHPSGRAAPVRGVSLMLHGCTQSPEDFATGTRMNDHGERHGLIVVYAEQARSDNVSLCWNWFRPGDRSRSGGEAALLAGLAAAVAADHGVPSGAVFVAGLSAGGAMAAILAQSHPEVFAAAGVHSGLAPGAANDVVSAFAAMRGDLAPGAEPLNAPAIIFHGSADGTVAPLNAGHLAGRLEATKTRTGEASGRRYDVLAARNANGHPVEVWRIDGAGHAWSGGDTGGSYTDSMGPDASAEMVRFFLEQVQA